MKYVELYKQRFEKFKTAKTKGRSVNFLWLWTKARVLPKEMTGTDALFIKSHVKPISNPRFKTPHPLDKPTGKWFSYRTV